ncbi:hypothetical protein [Vibrio parahaemolyticus]|uniref:hypothetical protein n=1 Tax=Vibrio parahaemolyticus TaxID=670 RepID=UPI001A210494|nr:hypothetical protein [Vibrio parahaemolyticus]EID0723907.1 hypothetical protein [Vibrio parahaemolyticus]EJG1587822.1 hypothetical protein [Vibrio parahaemolyticus]HCH3521612.1 hypothetical protein [Vibrio parahaemolyticus]HCH6535975.1 hypothetical protein [Vibrio parahaemolyticus]
MLGFQPLDQVASMAKLTSNAEEYVVRVYRQSGNMHQDDRYANSKAQAISLAISTLRRAKKDVVRLNVNRSDKLSLHGMYNAKGRQEGKKVGEVQILAIGANTASKTPQRTQTTHVRNFQPNQGKLQDAKPKDSSAGMIFKGIMLFVLMMVILCW